MIAQLQEEVIQGPVEHERLGRVIVVRPTIETARANRFPSQAVVITTAARRLMSLSKEGERVQAVLVLGDKKDPTVHPEFHEISQNLRELMKKWFPKGLLCLVSDAPELGRPQTRHALSFYDQPIVRLEAGTQKTFTALTGGKPGSFKAVVNDLCRLEIERLIVQARFVRGERVDNSKEAEVNAWVRHLAYIKPARVHISTPEKQVKGAGKPVTKTRMAQIAELVSAKTGIAVELCET